MFIKRSIKVFVIAIVAFAFASVATAYAGANTVPDSNAGDAAKAISGIVVTNVQYTVTLGNTEATTYISKVTLTLDPAAAAASTIQIKLVASGGAWYDCVNGGTTVTCDTGGTLVTVVAANNLRVIAY